MRRWNKRAICTSVEPIRCRTSMVVRWLLCAARAARTTIAAVASVISRTRPNASHVSARISCDSGARKAACGSTLADGAMARSEEHTSELQSLMRISYAVFCLKKKKKQLDSTNIQITQESILDTHE